MLPEMTEQLPDAPLDAALHEVERLLDSLPLMVAARGVAGWRARRRRRLMPAHRGAGTDAVLHGSFDSVAQAASALALALRGGALESAATLVDQLLPQLADLPPSQAEAAVVPVTEGLLMLGRRREALAIATAHQALLARDRAGATVLELLDIPGRAWLPGGGPNWLGLGRQVVSGRLNASELAAALPLTSIQWLRYPEARLLFFSALWRQQPERALRFLNGFLDSEGVPSRLALRALGFSTTFLGSLRSNQVGSKSGGPLVSIIIAAHRAAGTLSYAIESLLGQSYANIEVLVGDDASDDATVEVMLRCRQDRRVRLFRSDRNQGAYNLRTALAEHARGQFVTFHDADDYALPLRIERQVACLRRAGVVGCVSNLLRVNADGNVVFSKHQRASRLSRVSLMLPREVFFDLGAFRPARVGADEELQAALGRRFGHNALNRIAAPLMLCLSSPTSATRASGSEALDDGYRSASRRAYSELIFRKYRIGEEISDEAVSRRLRETGNYEERASLRELTKF